MSLEGDHGSNTLPIAKPSATPNYAPEGVSDGEEQEAQDLGELRCKRTNDCSEPRLLHLSHTQKSAEYLNSRGLFFFN